ncbi:acyl-CoA-binding domain-containing protein 6-like [Amphibalanus amphitrite]|uniref:acyl-CoA-binding domain-containing protein 6-like n=1 Tax=Amphibalanus amphitrite TaxID=1232801 RepID=UPI001C915BE2|nr:acyl-CoA-binding domain-containing protein 6-like [Amphibalanus amphitrite]
MGDLEKEMISEAFDDAARCVELLASSGRLPDDDLLRLYACYKQATCGECRGQRPGLFSLSARRKFDAWKSLGEMTELEAKRRYVEILTELQPNWMSGGDAETAGQPRGLGIAVSTPVRAEEDGATVGDDASPLDLVKAGRCDLLAQRATFDCESADGEGLRLLHWAADRGHVDIVRLLLTRGATVDCRDADGQTPLHYAASCGHTEVARVLLEAGADPKVTDTDGVTPAEGAEGEVRSLLDQAGKT